MSIVASMIPVGIVGVFFKEEVEAIFNGGFMDRWQHAPFNSLLVGILLLIQATPKGEYFYKRRVYHRFVSSNCHCTWIISLRNNNSDRTNAWQ